MAEAKTDLEAEYEHILKEIGRRQVELSVWTRRAEFLYVEILRGRAAQQEAEKPATKEKIPS